jgi:hypothetical protein
MVAMGGLGGIPPIGLFPGLILVLLAIAANEPWLLLPIGTALLVTMRTGLPESPPLVSGYAHPSTAWLPLGLALIVGYAAPAGLLNWLHAMAAWGR